MNPFRMSVQQTLDRLRIPYKMIRGKPFVFVQGDDLAAFSVDSCVDGIPVHVEHRRYSNTTFYWVKFFWEGKWIGLGDPWPGKPSLEDVAGSIRLTIAKLKETNA